MNLRRVADWVIEWIGFGIACLAYLASDLIEGTVTILWSVIPLCIATVLLGIGFYWLFSILFPILGIH